MFVTRICYHGVKELEFVEPGAKINANYYIEQVLKPMYAYDIPKLFGKQQGKMVFDHDSAPTHSTRATQKFHSKQRGKFISKEQWMGNSPDLASMDYAINGIF